MTDALLIDAKALATMLSVSISTLYRLQSAGKLPRAVALGAGSKRWKRADIESWISLDCCDRKTFEALTRDDA